MKQCIDEAKIATKNVLKILPYAVKYHPTALDRMFNVIKSGVPTRRLGEFLPGIAESKHHHAVDKMSLPGIQDSEDAG